MNNMLRENEVQANVVAAKVMGITFLIFSLVLLLNVVGVFTIDGKIMTVCYAGGSAILWLPAVLVKTGNRGAAYLKYIIVACASLFVLLISAALTYHVTILYVYGIAIASLYFSKKLNVFATVLAVLCTAAGQMLAFHLGTTPDHNFDTLRKTVVFGIAPRALVTIAMAAIFTMLCSRTAALLGSVMGAEEQKKMLERVTRLQAQSREVSASLHETVLSLEGLAQRSSGVNQELASQTEEIAAGTKENAGQIAAMNRSLNDISQQMERFGQMNDSLAEAAGRIRELSARNQSLMEMATGSMGRISDSAGESMENMRRLSETSEEIGGIVKTITDISMQTKLLALNATIEAARAGEQGKGFAVVAGEIRRLSEQTQDAVDNIGNMIREMVENTQRAAASMEESVRLTGQGRTQIREAGDSTRIITASNEEMSEQIDQLVEISSQLLDEERSLTDAMRLIHQNTDANLHAVEQVASATGESSRSAEQLVGVVERVREMAERLVEGSADERTGQI